MRKFTILFSSLVLLFLLSACGGSETEPETTKADKNKWDEIQEAGELVVGTSGTLIAASYYDGEEESEDQLTGYDVEVMKEIAERLGLDISFEIMGIDSMLPALQSGRIDLAANDIEVTDKRLEEFNFSEPYKYSYTTMEVRKEDNSEIN